MSDRRMVQTRGKSCAKTKHWLDGKQKSPSGRSGRALLFKELGRDQTFFFFFFFSGSGVEAGVAGGVTTFVGSTVGAGLFGSITGPVTAGAGSAALVGAGVVSAA